MTVPVQRNSSVALPLEQHAAQPQVGSRIGFRDTLCMAAAPASKGICQRFTEWLSSIWKTMFSSGNKKPKELKAENPQRDVEVRLEIPVLPAEPREPIAELPAAPLPRINPEARAELDERVRQAVAAVERARAEREAVHRELMNATIAKRTAILEHRIAEERVDLALRRRLMGPLIAANMQNDDNLREPRQALRQARLALQETSNRYREAFQALTALLQRADNAHRAAMRARENNDPAAEQLENADDIASRERAAAQIAEANIGRELQVAQRAYRGSFRALENIVHRMRLREPYNAEVLEQAVRDRNNEVNEALDRRMAAETAHTVASIRESEADRVLEAARNRFLRVQTDRIRIAGIE